LLLYAPVKKYHPDPVYGWQIGWQMISLDPHFSSLFVLLSMKKSIQIRHHSYRSAIRTCLAIKIHNKSILFFSDEVHFQHHFTTFSCSNDIFSRIPASPISQIAPWVPGSIDPMIFSPFMVNPWGTFS
jgi:hypothetical protein